MLQICQPKKYSLTPNKLFLPQQDSTEPAFSETGYTDQNDEARLNSTKTKTNMKHLRRQSPRLIENATTSPRRSPRVLQQKRMI
mmetsp:Transcript_6826/g.14764  ORF Transcript_6826/g.14764 Transcript_6826/m.14764 type:complete len:84 (-) Transcript_6826:51-302(-)